MQAVRSRGRTLNRYDIRVMIILRQHKLTLYYISSNPNLEKELLKPSIPNNFLVKQKYEDWKIPRIPLYTSVSDALSGSQFLGQNLEGQTLHVYKALGTRYESILTPSITSIPYSLILNEKWYCYPLRLKKEKEIEIIEKDKEEFYHYGPRSTKGKIIRWIWKEKENKYGDRKKI